MEVFIFLKEPSGSRLQLWPYSPGDGMSLQHKKPVLPLHPILYDVWTWASHTYFPKLRFLELWSKDKDTHIPSDAQVPSIN